MDAARREWLNPTVVVAILGIVGTAYAGFMVQRERIARLEQRVERIEIEYERRAVIASELKAIHAELDRIRRVIEQQPR